MTMIKMSFLSCAFVLTLLLFASCNVVYDIPYFSSTEIFPASQYELILNGAADLSIFQLDILGKCDISNPLYKPLDLTARNYQKILLQDRPLTLQNRKYFISPGFRPDYYILTQTSQFDDVKNNPISFSMYFALLFSRSDNPYQGNLSLSPTYTVQCLPGIALFTSSSKFGMIHMNKKPQLAYGFTLEYEIYHSEINTSATAGKFFNLSIVLHNFDLTEFYNQFISSGNTLAFAVNSVIINLSMEQSSYLISIAWINQLGSRETVLTMTYVPAQFNENLMKIQVVYSFLSNSFTNDCYIDPKNGLITVLDDGSGNKGMLKIYINSALISCVSLNLAHIIHTDGISSTCEGCGNISLIGNYTANPNMLVIVAAIKLISHVLTCSNSYTCGKVNEGAIIDENAIKTIRVRNISADVNENISMMYSYKHLSEKYYPCGNHQQKMSVSPRLSSFLFSCASTLTFVTSTVADIFIKNRRGILYQLSSIYPIYRKKRLYPSDLYDICVFSSKFTLQVGYCDCRYCLKILQLSKGYASYDLNICVYEFGKTCNCFEQSSVNEGNMSGFSFMSFNICVECTHNSHCQRHVKSSTCEVPSKAVQAIFNPIKVNIDSALNMNSASYFIDNPILGDKCLCSISQPYVSLNSNRFQYSVYAHFPIVAILDDMQKCIQCLYDAAMLISSCDSFYCNSYKISGIDYYMYPSSGNGCRSCVLSSELLQILSITNSSAYAAISACIDNHKQDYFSQCLELIQSLHFNPGDIFSGLLTHFRVECPGRPFKDHGSVCIPWFGFNFYSRFTLAYKKTSNLSQWDVDLECMNAACEKCSKSNCIATSCVCFDTCPLGFADFPVGNKHLQVPCSGNGVCSATYGCICDPGYLTPNCKIHCSETPGGCCVEDEDCKMNNSSEYDKCIRNSTSDIGYCGT